MMRVRFFSEFCSSENCADVYKRILDVVPVPCYGRSIVFTTGEDYTHAVILNKATPDLTCPKENVLGLAFEPRPFLRLTDSFLGYARENIGAYYIGDADGLGWPFVGHHGFMWHPATIKEKTRIMWMVFSEKTESFGHRYRHEIVRRILGDGLPIDVYERGCPLYGDHERLRGVFTDAEPYDGYAFSIVVENFSSPHYFSEKIMNPLLFETVPLYYGATRIDSRTVDPADGRDRGRPPNHPVRARRPPKIHRPPKRPVRYRPEAQPPRTPGQNIFLKKMI
jgi:hypothetical protein